MSLIPLLRRCDEQNYPRHADHVRKFFRKPTRPQFCRQPSKFEHLTDVQGCVCRCICMCVCVSTFGISENCAKSEINAFCGVYKVITLGEVFTFSAEKKVLLMG